MRVIETKVFTYDELTDDAKAKARNWWREGFEYDSFHYESDFDYYKDEKFPDFNLTGFAFSGFGSQGDGASFRYETDATVWEQWVVDNDNIRPLLKKVIADYDVTAYVGSRRNTHRYCHGNTITAELDTLEYYDIEYREDSEDRDYCNVLQAIDQLANAFAEYVSALMYDGMQDLYRDLEKDYFYLISDEHAEESIRANEYTFTKAGTRFG